MAGRQHVRQIPLGRKPRVAGAARYDPRANPPAGADGLAAVQVRDGDLWYRVAAFVDVRL